MKKDKNRLDLHDKNKQLEVFISSVLGDREEQQDCADMAIKKDEGLVVVCDGMGGMSGGKAASHLAVESLINDFNNSIQNKKMNESIIESLKNADKKIAALSDENGKPLRAGSTATVVYIKNRLISWFSVGDSRIYLFRDGELSQLSTDHTYKSLLDSQLKSNLISIEEYNQKIPQGEALISFLGVGNLSRIDYNQSPFLLKSNDRIIMMSDGLYKLLDNIEICNILNNFKKSKDALNLLNRKSKEKAKEKFKKQDNTTIAIIHIK